ncbi:uncharacterized protein LOC111075314 [Drosophila obscura]|uniref:uncharacterized protein LOC111075314 n=1 Tax=Drosophila obscura TaxID=7282 RepID=UPI001BB21F77|nr:uncharacterized protein LOC111075314 [Drosophila obscura]
MMCVQLQSSLSVSLLTANGLAKDQWSISAKMVDPLPTRLFVITLLMVLMALGSCQSSDEADTKWMAPLKQYGWSASQLKNKVEHGDFTTFELGTPNYQILNPEDEPEYITADQPHYQEMLRRLTSAQSGTDTIDVPMAGSSHIAQSAPVNSQAQATLKQHVDDASPRQLQAGIRISPWEKLKKRSFYDGEEDNNAVEAEPWDEQSLHPRIQVYAGARPFQSRVSNLS